MNDSQRKAFALATYAIALILFLFFFAHPFWQWATWNSSKGTLDLGFLKVTNRPDFPNDAKAIVCGLILPIVIAAIGRVVQVAKTP